MRGFYRILSHHLIVSSSSRSPPDPHISLHYLIPLLYYHLLPCTTIGALRDSFNAAHQQHHTISSVRKVTGLGGPGGGGGGPTPISLPLVAGTSLSHKDKQAQQQKQQQQFTPAVSIDRYLQLPLHPGLDFFQSFLFLFHSFFIQIFSVSSPPPLISTHSNLILTSS